MAELLPTEAPSTMTESDPDEATAASGAPEDGGPGASPDAPGPPVDGDGAEEEAGESGRSGLGPGEQCSDEELRVEVAALLFASPDPLSPARLRELLLRPRAERVRDALEALQAELEASGLPIVLRQIAGGWRFLTDPRLGEVVGRLRKEAKPERISGAALETLAIIAYRQPVTKAEVEAIRGVQAGAMLRTLVDRGLARVSGRADQPGAPLQYATTREFLERFGLASLEDLPRDGELTEE